MRADGIPVSQQVIQMKARAAAEEDGLHNFTASYCWLKGFKQRQRLSLRTRGAQGQQPPEDAQVIVEAFGKTVAEEAARLGVTEVWNADETAVFFELIPRRTIDTVGTKTVWVRCAGAERRRVSVLLLGSSLGRKKPPFLVFKETPSKVPTRRQENEATRNGFGARVWHALKDTCPMERIFANKAGWLTGPLIVRWLDLMFHGEPGSKLLLLDEFSGHWTGEVLEKCRELNITLLGIPAGCTSVSQPADVAWNRPFKAQMRKLWVERLMDTVKNNRTVEPPSRETVCSWVSTAWEALVTIENGFRASRIFVNTDSQVEELSLALSLAEIQGDVQLAACDGEEGGNTTEDE